MFYIIFILLGLILAALIYLATLNGAYDVRQTRLINANINSSFNKIRDFKSWPDWSPWLMHEAETKLTYSDNCDEQGGYYQWDGQRVGAGKLTHIKFDRPHRIEQRLEFTRPFKSVCQVGFEFAEKDGQTEVAWIMHGKMPFLFRFMAKKTRNMISQDYELGLAMLAGQLDPKAETPQLQFEGVETMEPQQALCHAFSGGLREMETAMQDSFPKLMAYLEQQQVQAAGTPFTAYHKVNTKTMHFVCDMAVPVAEQIDAGDYRLKTLGGGRFYKVTLKGSYAFLELAWYAAITHVQMLKLKYDSPRDSLEVYENDPRQLDNSNEIKTTIYVPIK